MSVRPVLDERCDVFHAGVLVLSLMIGRSLGPDDYPGRIAELLDQIEDRSIWHEPETFRSVRRWVERALQIGDDVFATAREANAAVADLQEEPPRPEPHPQLRLAPKPRSAQEATSQPEPAPVEEEPPAAAAKTVAFPTRLRDPRVLRWATIVVALVAIGEAAYIGQLLMNGPSTSPGARTIAAAPVTTPPSPVRPASTDEPHLTPPPVEISPLVQTTAVPTLAATKAPDPKLAKPAAAPLPVQALSPKSGGFKITSPIEVHVLDGDRLLGSSEDGPIIASAGRHELEFVNSAIGFRVRQVVDVKPGEIASLAVNVPNGTLNINATPWAAVSIDGNSYGETPLGNVSVAPGEHEIVFRHPQFGERREKAVVRPGASTRIAVTLK
jgi:PEGA domain